MSATARDRIIDAVILCVDRAGLGSFTLEDVAEAAGLSRATIYRHFPGGREQLMVESVTREVGTFWRHLAGHVANHADLESRLVDGLIEARRMIREDARLQRLVAAEPDAFLPLLAQSETLVHDVLVGYLAELLERESLRRGVDPAEAADYLGRMFLSHISATGQWRLDDEASVRRLIRTQFLAGILAGPAGAGRAAAAGGPA